MEHIEPTTLSPGGSQRWVWEPSAEERQAISLGANVVTSVPHPYSNERMAVYVEEIPNADVS